MSGGIPKPTKISEEVGDDIKGFRKDGSNSADPGINVQGGGAFGFTLWKIELGGDR